MSKVEDEKEKLKIYDDYLGQKYIDELPPQKQLELKLADFVKCVNKNIDIDEI